jgi:TetR/AcrR family transcriptional regulator, copper-responsive repressor
VNHKNEKTRRGRPITRNREHVLETATNAYWHDNLAATSVNAICALANVSKPSLYRDFGSEDGLTVAVLERYSSQVLVQIGDLLMSDASFATKLDELIKIASEDPQMETGCLFIKMRATRSRFGVQTQAKLANIEKQALSVYMSFFKCSHERGEWNANISFELAANYLLEQFGLAVTQRAAGRSKESVKELLTLSLSALKKLNDLI